MTVTPTVSSTGNVSYAVLDGPSASLWCNVTGLPAPIVSWYHNGTLIENSTDFYTEQLTTQVACGAAKVESRLDVLRVGLNNTGNVTCASNYVTSQEDWINKTTELVVECKCFSVRFRFAMTKII